MTKSIAPAGPAADQSYSPLYFLASLGAGGLAVTFFMYLMFWVPHPARLGVGLSILSYAGKVIVGVRFDEAVTKNPGRFVELFEQEVSGMLEKANS